MEVNVDHLISNEENQERNVKNRRENLKKYKEKLSRDADKFNKKSLEAGQKLALNQKKAEIKLQQEQNKLIMKERKEAAAKDKLEYKNNKKMYDELMSEATVDNLLTNIDTSINKFMSAIPFRHDKMKQEMLFEKLSSNDFLNQYKRVKLKYGMVHWLSPDALAAIVYITLVATVHFTKC